MNKIVSFLFICLLLADLHAQNTICLLYTSDAADEL